MNTVPVYPSWIDDYARMMHRSFSHMVPADWGPLDFIACWEHVDGSFIEHLHGAVHTLKKNNIALKEVARLFPSPSSFRACLYFSFMEWERSKHAQKERAREVIEYLVDVLRVMFKRDIWCEKENIVHDDAEIDALLRRLPFTEASEEGARVVARLGNSASAMSYVLYRDFYMSESFDVFGPYDVAHHYGEGHIFVQRAYPKLRPTELWPGTESLRCSSVNIYLVYHDVQMQCEFIGGHTLYTGNTITGLRRWAVEVDGRFMQDAHEIRELSEHIGTRVGEYWQWYESMSMEDLQLKFLEWAGFAFKPLFDKAGMSWKPSEKMRASLLGKPVGARLLVPTFPSFDEFVRSPDYEVYWLKKLFTE